MQDQRTQNSARNPPSLLQRIAARWLLPRFFRLAGWSAVVGLPALVLGPRRFVRFTINHPLMAAGVCALLLGGVLLQGDEKASAPAEFEIEPIDHFDQPVELIAAADPDEHPSPPASEESQSAEPQPAAAAASSPGDATSARPDWWGRSFPKARPTGGARLVWLTGDIEEVPPAEPSGPVRNAVRIPSNRR